MLIPTPHAEVMAFYPEKLPVYGKRAWCRAEFFVFALYAEMVGRDVRLYAAATDGMLRQFQDLKFHGDLFKDMPTDGEVTVEEDRHESMLAAMSPSSRGSSKKSINAGASAPELKAMAEASKRRTT